MLGELCFRHFQPNAISAEKSESEKHKCVDTNTSQGVPINNPSVLIHCMGIGKIKQQGCSIWVSSILLQHSQIFVFGCFFPLKNPVWLEYSVLVCALYPRECHTLLKIPELSVEARPTVPAHRCAGCWRWCGRTHTLTDCPQIANERRLQGSWTNLLKEPAVYPPLNIKVKSSQQTNYSGLLIHFLLCFNHFQTLHSLVLKSNSATVHRNSKIYPISNCLNLMSNPLNSLIQGSLNCCKYLWGGLCCLIATKGIIMLYVCAYIL